MKQYFLGSVSLLVLILAAVLIMGQQQDDQQKNRQEAANTGLKNLLALYDDETARTTGVPVDRIRNARLGRPLTLQYINAREVLKAATFTGIGGLLMPNTEYYFPVEADGAVIASIEVVKNKEGRWVPGQMGGFKLADGVNNIVNKILKNDSAVAIDRLRMYHSGPHGVLLIGFDKGGVQYLTPVQSRPDVNLRAGQVLTEVEALERLRDIYKQVDMNLPD
ncbi:hypothetical protein [Paraflavitalea pollutisoli]|uniref:hypothetical protein n=1 Tax=Paraflavitalea pollutisoli TaxID=3034143 RepID=UPI0023EB91CB|nr:hypothetical protein [Paraflavitalea sp. H1-2-19X]